MNKKISNYRLGLFVVVAIVILIGLIVSIGGGNIFRPKVMVETYFDESVQGLDIGSKVRYRGVVIGAVRHIGFTYTKYEQNKPPAERRQYVLVEMAIYPDQLGDVGGGREFVDRLVADGLRIRMVPIGVTGIVYLELDFNRTSPVMPINWVPLNLYIPSAQSTVLSFVESAERIMAKLEPLDLNATANNLDRLLVTLNRKAEALDTEKLSKEVTASLAELRNVLRHVDQVASSEDWQSLPADLGAAVRRMREIAESPELKRTLAALDRSSQRVDRALEGREDDIAELISNLRSASANLKTLSENLKHSPSGALLAQPPKPTDAYKK